MTAELWRKRSRVRITKLVKAAGRIALRDVMRRTHYNRGNVEGMEGIPAWFDGLEDLKKRGTVRQEGERPEKVWLVWAGN